MKLFCIGDSNTYGFDPLRGRYPSEVRWTGRIEQDESLGCEVVNCGTNGLSIPHHSNAYNRRISREAPDLVTVMLGSNDILGGASARQVAERMEVFLAGVAEAGRPILLIAPPVMQQGDWVEGQEVIDQSRRLGPLYRQIAQRAGCGFVDAGEWELPLTFDGVHLTPEGHATFARELAAIALRKRPRAQKLHLLHTPTPLTRLDRISADMGIDLWLKRDDMTDLGTGGNKLRKLEYLLKDALDQGATMLLTVGGAQTNHGRLTAAVAARYGMRSAIVAVDDYPGELSANLLLDAIMDCHVYLVKRRPEVKDSVLLKEAVAQVTREWEAKGERVYYIPMGGSNELGALGYYDCALELQEQIREHGLCDRKPRVVVTVGSMGTYVGLAAGIASAGLDMRLTGIGVLPYRDIRQSAAEYYERVRQAYGLTTKLSPQDLDVTSEYDCGGYNNPVEEVRQAIYYMGRMEGILLDPCYTGKTFLGIRRMAAQGRIRQGESVIMIHTGGIPGLYTSHHRVEMEEELKGHVHVL